MIETTQRCVVDEIVRDADGIDIAVLVADSGGTLTVPLELLPAGVRVNDVVDLLLRHQPNETVRRRQDVEELQRRLFHPGSPDSGTESRE